MERLNQNPDELKKREYESIQDRATRDGHLEGVHTHETHDAREVFHPTRSAPLMSEKNTATPGLGNGVEGTRLPQSEIQSESRPNTLDIIDDCGCDAPDEETKRDVINEVGD